MGEEVAVSPLAFVADELIESMRPDVAAGRQAMRLAFQGLVALAAATSERALRPTPGVEEGLRAAVTCSCRLCGAEEPEFVGAFCPGESQRWPSLPGRVRTMFFAVCGACAAAPGLEARLAEVLLRDGQQGPWSPESN
jgi:hypothetical protein